MNKDKILVIYQSEKSQLFDELQIQIEALKFRFPIEVVPCVDMPASSTLIQLKQAWAVVLLISEALFRDGPLAHAEVLEALAALTEQGRPVFKLRATAFEPPSQLIVSPAPMPEGRALENYSERERESFFGKFALAIADLWAPKGRFASIEMKNLGPTSSFKLECGPRFNIVTGDNSLGKTMIFDCIWWALTGTWTNHPAMPYSRQAQKEASISFGWLEADQQKPTQATARFDRVAGRWPAHISPFKSMVLYVRSDGTFSIWDPHRAARPKPPGLKEPWSPLVLQRNEVWSGRKVKTVSGSEVLFPGVERGWLDWQANEKTTFNLFEKLLLCLSPDSEEGLRPGRPEKIGEKYYPTLEFSYGSVLLEHAAESVRRIVALAFNITWMWQEHINSGIIAQLSHMVLIVDEIEVHLHPKWVRLMLSQLLNIHNLFDEKLLVQYFITTHSPLVLASLEPLFDAEKDCIFHLALNATTGQPNIESVPFMRFGPVDRWFTSELFGLTQARSKEAERAIEAAKAIMEEDKPDREQVRTLNHNLASLLGEGDSFWPRWGYFAYTHGGDS